MKKMSTKCEKVEVVELVYFRGRGFGEIIRLLLTVTDTPYNEFNLKTRDDYLKLLPDLQFEQIPLLRMDGMNIVQSGSIARHLARKHKLFGADEAETTRVDELYEGTRDFVRSYQTMGLFEDEEKTKASIVETTLPKYCRIFNQILATAATEDGYLVGSRLTLADLGLLECLLATVDYFTEEAFKDYIHLQAFYKRLTADEKIVKYIQEVRRPKNDPSMLAEARVIMSHMKH